MTRPWLPINSDSVSLLLREHVDQAARPVYARDIGEFGTRLADTFNAMRPLIPEKLTELLDLLSGRSVDLKVDILGLGAS